MRPTPSALAFDLLRRDPDAFLWYAPYGGKTYVQTARPAACWLVEPEAIEPYIRRGQLQGGAGVYWYASDTDQRTRYFIRVGDGFLEEVSGARVRISRRFRSALLMVRFRTAEKWATILAARYSELVEIWATDQREPIRSYRPMQQKPIVVECLEQQDGQRFVEQASAIRRELEFLMQQSEMAAKRAEKVNDLQRAYRDLRCLMREVRDSGALEGDLAERVRKAADPA